MYGHTSNDTSIIAKRAGTYFIIYELWVQSARQLAGLLKGPHYYN